MSIAALAGAAANRAGVAKLITENVTDSPAAVLDWLGGNLNLETAIALAMFIKGSRLITLDGRPGYGAFAEGTPATELYTVQIETPNVPAIGPPITAEHVAFLQMVRQAYQAADAYILDLVACHQVGALKESNIHGYFMERNNTDIEGSKVLKVLNALYVMLPSFVSDAGLRAELAGSTFVQYHTAASSTPVLLSKFVAEQPQSAAAMISVADLAAIAAANTDIWDLALSRRISHKAIVIGAAYLKVNGALPDGWRQFEKARNSTSTLVWSNSLAYFTRLSELQSNAGAMAGVATEAALIAALPANIRA